MLTRMKAMTIKTGLIQAGYQVHSGNLAKDGVIMVPQAEGMLVIKRVGNRCINTFLTWEEMDQRITYPSLIKCARCHTRDVEEKGDLCPQCDMAIKLEVQKKALKEKRVKHFTCEICDTKVFKVTKVDGLEMCPDCQKALV